MSSIIQTTFVLTGPLAGKTINLGSQPYRFQLGKCQIVAPFEQMALHARFLERNWEAYPEGHEGLRGIQGDLPPNGEGTAPGQDSDAGERAPEGDGQAPQLNEKLQKAVLGLDPEDDSHWTKDGKPAMTAAEKLYGSSGLTRADVEAAAPGFTREKAKAAAGSTDRPEGDER